MLVKITEAAIKLSCSSQHIRKMIREGKVPSYKLGPKSTRVDLEEIRGLIFQPAKQQWRSA